jgi:hypothetical protein
VKTFFALRNKNSKNQYKQVILVRKKYVILFFRKFSLNQLSGKANVFAKKNVCFDHGLSKYNAKAMKWHNLCYTCVTFFLGFLFKFNILTFNDLRNFAGILVVYFPSVIMTISTIATFSVAEPGPKEAALFWWSGATTQSGSNYVSFGEYYKRSHKL